MTPVDPNPDAFAPTAHPVRRFVLALGLVVTGCLAAWWAGIAAPRLSASASAPPTQSATEPARVTVLLRNEGPLPFELRGLTEDYPGIEFGVVRVDGHDLSTGSAEVSPGDSARVEAQVSVDCRLLRGDNPDPAFWYTDETFRLKLGMPIGVERTRALRVSGALNALLSRSCANPRPTPAGE